VPPGSSRPSGIVARTGTGRTRTGGMLKQRARLRERRRWEQGEERAGCRRHRVLGHLAMGSRSARRAKRMVPRSNGFSRVRRRAPPRMAPAIRSRARRLVRRSTAASSIPSPSHCPAGGTTCRCPGKPSGRAPGGAGPPLGPSAGSASPDLRLHSGASGCSCNGRAPPPHASGPILMRGPSCAHLLRTAGPPSSV
jgi:hypothetical protein